MEANFSWDSGNELLFLSKYTAGYNSFVLIQHWVTHQESERYSHSPQLNGESALCEEGTNLTDSIREKWNGKSIRIWFLGPESRFRGYEILLIFQKKLARFPVPSPWVTTTFNSIIRGKVTLSMCTCAHLAYTNKVSYMHKIYDSKWIIKPITSFLFFLSFLHFFF